MHLTLEVSVFQPIITSNVTSASEREKLGPPRSEVEMPPSLKAHQEEPARDSLLPRKPIVLYRDESVQVVVARTKPLNELRPGDVPRGLDPEDVANDAE